MKSGLRFVFLDASHHRDDVLAEFELVKPKLAPDAVVLFDNTYRIADGDEDPRANGALRTIRKRYGGNLINLEFRLLVHAAPSDVAAGAEVVR